MNTVSARERTRDLYLQLADQFVDNFTENGHEVYVIRVSGLPPESTELTIRNRFRDIFGTANIERIIVVPPADRRNLVECAVGYVRYSTRYSMQQCIRECYGATHYTSNLHVERVFSDEMDRHA